MARPACRQRSSLAEDGPSSAAGRPGLQCARMHRAAPYALAAVLASLLVSPMHRELYVGDETKYAQVVREMGGGMPLVPTLEGAPFTHKPPLHFWAISLLTHVFDLYSIWPFLLPSLLSFCLLMLLMRRMESPLAAFVCGSSILMLGSAQTARMDVAFAALLALSAWMIWRWFEGENTLPAAGAAAGVAFLVKGPMAPVIAAAIFGIELLRRRREGRAVPAFGRPGLLAAGIMLAIPLLWLIPAIVTGGEAYWREIFFKQTVGRAVDSWVHKSPPWFYLVRAPLTMAPWFLLLVAAVVAAWRRRDDFAKFGVSWMLGVLVPYTLLSSKLDVYMITLLPAVALVIARYAEEEDALSDWGRRANLFTLLVLLLVGVAGLLVRPFHVDDPAGILVQMTPVRLLFATLFAASLAAIIITFRGRVAASTMALGLVPVLAFSWIGAFLVPIANEIASTRPLVRVLERQPVAPSEIALYASPHLWVRGMNPAFGRIRHVDEEDLRSERPALLVVRRKNAAEIQGVLRGYEKIDQFVLLRKWFDVYRR